MMSGFSEDLVAAILGRQATGDAAGAAELIGGADLSADDRQVLLAAVAERPPAEFAAVLGAILRGDPANRDAVNECNRAEFYLSGRSRSLAGNPLYALFLAGRDGTLVDKWVHYFEVYHRNLAGYRGRSPRVLEIGVYRGGGLAMWREYFGAGAVVVGVDIDPAAAAVGGPSPVMVGDQSDPAFLRTVSERFGPFDVVIDDGGHTMAQQVTAAATLFPLLAAEGAYIVEDTHTSYWPEYRDQEETFIGWVRGLIDALHANHDPSGDPDSVWATTLDAIEISDSVVVLRKANRFRPFSEVGGGTGFLFESRTAAARISALEQREAQLVGELERLREAPTATPESDEVRLLRSTLREARAEMAVLARELEATRRELSTTQGRLLDAWEHIRRMRNTVSWRLTTPLRVGRLVRRR